MCVSAKAELFAFSAFRLHVIAYGVEKIAMFFGTSMGHIAECKYEKMSNINVCF